MTENELYIRLYLSLVDWRWYKVPLTCHFFIHLLINVRWSDGYGPDGKPVKKGEYAATYGRLSADCGMSEDQIKTAVKNLKSDGTIRVKRRSKYNLYIVENFGKYQPMIGEAKKPSSKRKYKTYNDSS